MTNVSIKRVGKSRIQQEIDDNIVMGWKLKNRNEDIAILTKPGGWGSATPHIIIFILTAWWTAGIGNLIYALYSYYSNRNELQIKADNTETEII